MDVTETGIVAVTITVEGIRCIDACQLYATMGAEAVEKQAKENIQGGVNAGVCDFGHRRKRPRRIRGV